MRERDLDQVIIEAAYAYEAKVVPKRHRNGWTQTFRASAPVAIARIAEADAPVALRHERTVKGTGKDAPPTKRLTEFRWDGERFLIPVPGPDGMPMSLEAFARRMSGQGMVDPATRKEISWVGNPLVPTHTTHEKKVVSKDVFGVLTREQRADEIRIWEKDDRDDRLASLHGRAMGVVVVGDVVHKAVREPVWELDMKYGRADLKVLRTAPEPDDSKVRFRLDRRGEAESLAARICPKSLNDVADSVEVVIGESLRFDSLACNAASLFETVVPKLGEMAVMTATGEAARAWADMRDAQAAWLSGDPDGLNRAYVSLARLAEADWTKGPGVKSYHEPSPKAAMPFLAAYEEFEGPRLADAAAMDGLGLAP